jgi:hypothetical protein
MSEAGMGTVNTVEADAGEFNGGVDFLPSTEATCLWVV